MLLFWLQLFIFCQASAQERQYTDQDNAFRDCCRRKGLDCAETSCYYQVDKNDVRTPAKPDSLDGKDCFTEDGFRPWRQCYITAPTLHVPSHPPNNTHCCRPKGKKDALSKQCLDLCDYGKDIDGNSAADYTSCEEFRYRINCCNAINEATICNGR